MIYIDYQGKSPIRNMVTIEHLIIPCLGQSKQGAETVAACRTCNQDKAREYEKQYIEYHRLRSSKRKK